jgi:undecaprenyl-diphosphatase
MSWLEALILGVIQGVTEFLPVSSDGHLTLFQIVSARLQGRAVSGEENKFFDIMLHLGTTAAILVHSRHAIRAGAKGLLGSADVPEGYRRGAIVRVGLLAFVATLPLVPDALFLKKWIDSAFQSLTATGVGFLITAAVLGITAWLTSRREGDPEFEATKSRKKGPFETSVVDALLVGIAQMFAPLPGVSRSGLTIATALALGFSRTWAVGFSLLLAVPAIFGAAVFELRHVDRSMLSMDRVGPTVGATVVAGLVGYAAIVWLVRIVRSGRMWYFSVYLVVLGVAVLVGARMTAGGGPDGRVSPALDGPARGGAGGSGARLGAGRAVRAVDRADAPGARAGRAVVGLAAGGRRPAACLVLGRPVAGRPREGEGRAGLHVGGGGAGGAGRGDRGGAARG